MSRRLQAFLQDHRNRLGLTQVALAAKAEVSRASIYRLESGSYVLPQRAGGHVNGSALERVASALGQDAQDVVRLCFDEEEIRGYYRQSANAAPAPSGNHVVVGTDMSRIEREAIALLGAMFNDRAMINLIGLERLYPRFELLVTNDPPFMLFADKEYIEEGSETMGVPLDDRPRYHELVAQHQKDVRRLVMTSQKTYQVVLRKSSLIDFLRGKSPVRAQRITRDMIEMLRYPGFDLVVLDQALPLDEFEVISSRYPFSPRHGLCIQHRRHTIDGQQIIYQPSIVGAHPTLVAKDYENARRFWVRGLEQADQVPDRGRGGEGFELRHKRAARHLLSEAFLAAHPNVHDIDSEREE